MKMKKILIIAAAMSLGAVVHAADPAAGKEKSKACAACHGETGISQVADFPKLAGQYSDYLVRALSDYKSGARKNAIMAGQAQALSRADIDGLADYYASLPGSLQVAMPK